MSKVYEYVEPNTIENKILCENFTSVLQPSFVLIGNEKICMNSRFIQVMNDIENFEIRDDDIFLISYPKTGTSWTLEMVWILMHDLDKEEKRENFKETAPFLELTSIYDYSKIMEENHAFIPPNHVYNSIKIAEKCPLKPRIIKTHLPWSLLPKQIRDGAKKPKIIYIARNVKDTCVSYYHHGRLLSGHKGNFEDFCKLFQAGLVQYGNYISHVKNYFPNYFSPNFLFITYEQLQNNLTDIIEKISTFLNKPLLRTSPRMKTIIDLLSFENMKKSNISYNRSHVPINRNFFDKSIEVKAGFMRKGISGSHKTEMTDEINKQMDKWIEENVGKNHELKKFICQ